MNSHLQHWMMLARQLLFSYLQICNLSMSILPRWPKPWPNSVQSPPLASSALLQGGPLIQLQVPPQLSSPANWNFVKERLTEEELEEEEGSNQMLPWLFHPTLAKLDEKHLTRCAAATVHWLLRRAAFKTNVSQNKVAEKFQVAPKKLHEAIMGQKYDPGQKMMKTQKEAKDDKEKQKKQKTTPEKEPPEKATPDTTEMDTMPPLEDINDDNGAKKKFKFKKPTSKPCH